MSDPEGFPNQPHALRYRLACGVNHKMLAVPWVILAGNNLFPGRRFQTGDVDDSLLHPTPMLFAVEAPNLHLYEGDSHGIRYRDPGIPSQLNRIDRIRHYGSTNSEIVLRDRVGNAIPGIINWLAQKSRISERLFHRVDAHMHGADLTGQFLGNGCLASSG